MGNFSRDTFDPAKNYVGVRLEQGVPLVDADWNELNDVVRQDTYNGLAGGLGDGVARVYGGSAFAFLIYPASRNNDFYFLTGDAIVGGRPVSLPIGWTTYSAQPWTDPAKAAHDGVPVLPPLTTPTADRADLVYLDVWEREVDHTEDSDIVNPVIGVETATRLKREAAVRVAEGAVSVPTPPARHQYMWLATLNRPANQATIDYSAMEDHRTVLDASPGLRRMALQPAFQPIVLSGWTGWQQTLNWPQIYAYKPTNQAAIGVVPLTLPHGALLHAVEFLGQTRGTAGTFYVALIRSRNDAVSGAGIIPGWILADSYINDIGIFDRYLGVQARDMNITPPGPNMQYVDDSQYVYYLYAWSSGNAFEVEIHSASVYYQL